MNHAFLHPHGLGFDFDRGFDNFWHVISLAKHIDNIDMLRNIFEALVSFFAQHFGLAGVHRDNPIASRLQITRDTVTWTKGFAGKSDDGDGVALLECLCNWVPDYG